MVFCAAAIFGCALNSIIGIWTGSVSAGVFTYTYTFEFKTDNTFTQTNTITGGANPQTISESGTYTVQDTTVTMVITTYTVNGVSATPESATVTFTFVRAGDTLILTPTTGPAVPIPLTKE